MGNLVSLWIYYCLVVDQSAKRCVIVLSKEENTIHLTGHGFWNQFICGCFFGRSVFLNNLTLKNAFIQYRLRHASFKKCACCGCNNDELWCYLRGYDEMLNANDENNQIEVESEEQTLCHQKWNQATVNILKHVLNAEERKWLILYMIRNSYCAILKSVDNISDEYSLILPSQDDRSYMVDL